MNSFNLSLLCFVAFSAGCAIDPPQQKSGVTYGCAGISKNSPACLPAQEQIPESEDSRNKGTPAKVEPLVQAPADRVPAEEVPAASTNPTLPATSSNPFSSIFDKLGDTLTGAIDKIGSGGGGGGTAPTSSPTTDSNLPTQTIPSSSGPAAQTTTASVTLTATRGVYFKKNSNTDTSRTSTDFCLVGYGVQINASCVSAYTDTVYYVTGANACSGFTAGYIYKSSVNVTGAISSRCP
jgi:hypothetical protein